jgi:DNA polymerase III subunit gamma/tau
MAWYNKYRPQNFEDVIGQQLVKSVLQNSITQSKIKHGYLLSGPKGTGKTTLARIFANQLNQVEVNPEARMDIIELDAASNTGVDNIRQLIDSAQTPPFAGNYKVYIIDEVHMLSKSAMNALLKILEEPPSYLIFLLATTNPEKLLPTVLSRLTKLNLTSHTEADIVSRIQFIANQEGVKIDIESLELIAKRANGGQRDAINLLETLYSYNLNNYTLEETTKLLGLLPIQTLEQISLELINQNSNLGQQLSNIEQTGIDGESFLGQWLEYLLSQSFVGQSQFDSLIMPIAEILNLRLPINTVVASLALVQAKFRQINTIIPTVKKQPLSEKKTKLIEETTKIEEKIEVTTVPTSFLNNYSPNDTELSDQPNTQFQNVDSEQDTNLENSEPKQIKEEAKEEAKIQFANTQQQVAIKEIKQDTIKTDELKINQVSIVPTLISTAIIKSISSQPNCPSILKMISTDMELESEQDSTIFISLSSPMFLSQLKQPKNQEFLKTFLESITGSKISLEVIKRELKGKPKLPINKQDTPKMIQGGQDEKSDIQSDQALQEKLKSSISSQSFSAGTFFYSVYQGLPEDTVGDISQVPIWTNQLDSAPVIDKLWQNSNSSQNRDDHLEAMFDFE